MGARGERGRWFVEPDVAVRADPQDHHVDPTRFRDGPLIAFAFGNEVWGATIQKADVLRKNVDVVEQPLFHERPVASGIAPTESYELIEIEGADTGPIHVFGVRQS